MKKWIGFDELYSELIEKGQCFDIELSEIDEEGECSERVKEP